jgi:excisionase family DNA binding protein
MTQTPIIEPLLRPADAAKLLAISERTLRRLTATGRIPVVRFGWTVRYDPADIQALIAGHKSGSLATAL